jgi:hypothetical protein
MQRFPNIIRTARLNWLTHRMFISLFEEYLIISNIISVNRESDMDFSKLPDDNICNTVIIDVLTLILRCFT